MKQREHDLTTEYLLRLIHERAELEKACVRVAALLESAKEELRRTGVPDPWRDPRGLQ